MLKKALADIITSQPDVLQFAKDRKFEEAWIIPLSHTRPSEIKIDEYLSKDTFEVVIAEYIWNAEDDDKRFVMTVFLDKKCVLQDPKKFIHICLDSLYHYTNFAALIDSLNTLVVGNEYLLHYPIEAVNLSVFNHWLSVGPVDLWKLGDSLEMDDVIQKIKSRPDIERSTLNYQGLFFRFNISGSYNGPYYGIKTPCCNKQDESWVIDYDKVTYWMKIMLEK